MWIMWNPYSSFPHKSMEVIDELGPVQNKIIEISIGWFDNAISEWYRDKLFKSTKKSRFYVDKYI